MARSRRRTVAPFVEMLVVGVGGLAAGLVASLVVSVILAGVGIRVENIAVALAISVVGLAVGFGATALGYLRYRGLDISYLRIRVPDRGDIVWVIGGTLVLLLAVVLLSLVVELLPVSEPSDHEIIEIAQDRPEIMLYMIPLSLVFIGPGEELLFRGIVQTRLVGAYGETIGIVVTSVVFAAAHVPAYYGEGVVISLAVLFLLSLVIGWLYERTDNLVVPALVHGIYNAVLFLAVYVYITQELPI